MTQPFPFIEISGTPYERGCRYGEQAKARIHASVAIYGDQLDALHISRQQRADRSTALAPSSVILTPIILRRWVLPPRPESRSKRS